MAVVLNQPAGVATHSQPAGRAASALAAPARKSPARILAYGDSVSAGSACQCTPFPALLAQRLRHPVGSALSVSNMSVPSQTSLQLADLVEQSTSVAELRRADVVLITIGANDVEGLFSRPLCPRAGISCYAAALRQLALALDRIASFVDDVAPRSAYVVFVGYWNVLLDGAVARQRGDVYVSQGRRLTLAVNSEIRAAAHGHRALYLDTLRLFRGDADRDDTALLAADGDHPNARGHRLIAAALAATLRGAGCNC
jgi:lysophospholipase L1-like esterase